MSNKFKQQPKWLFLVLGLFFAQQSFAYKNVLTRPIDGVEGTDELIEKGSKLFTANCASCHALKGKVVGPALAGVINKYDEDYEWLNAWIKNNQKLIKSGDARANAIYDEYNGAAMNIFENLSDDDINSILMWIDNDGDGPTEGGGVTVLPTEPEPIPDSLFNNINWAIAIMSLLIFIIILMIFGILELVSNVTGKEIINWNNINAYMMLVFLVGFFGLVLYEYSIHKQFLLPESASEHGIELDKMMQWTFAATLPVFFITQFLLFYFSFKYRQKPGRKAYFLSHNNNLEYVWTIIPAIVLAVLVSGGFKMWNQILRSNAGEDTKKIEVFAYQFGWNARYPGADGELGTANYNLINGMNPLGVANKEHATELITELGQDIVSTQEAIDRLPQELAKLKSTLGGLVDDDRDARLRKIAEYTSGDKEDDLRLTIRARNTQIERLKGALKVEEGSMFTGKGDDDQVVGEIHLVKDELITFKFRARDVIHSAYLPYFRTQMNVVPGLPTEFTFRPIKSTEDMRLIKGDPEFDYYLVCNKICGNAHFNMKMKVVVEDQTSYDKWMNEQAGLFVKKEETENAETESTVEGTETVALN
jgi:cytochrome c oxidase subunit 2|tara:strand:- start:8221 stop:9993 length:1773 start_codon:yes stop_codon:yes gene_type:complete